MNRATIVRGIQLIVAITLVTFTYLLVDSIHTQKEGLATGLAHLHVGYLVIGALLALQEGVLGGLRIYVLARVLSRDIRVRTAIVSEFVLMFCAGVTPGQAGAAPSQVAVLVTGGMRIVDVATAEMLVALSTVTFFLASGLLVFILRAKGLMVVAQDGAHIDFLLGLSVVAFGSIFLALVLCAAYPPLLKVVVRALAPPLGAVYRALLRLVRRISRFRIWADNALDKPGAVRDRLLQSVDELNAGFRIYLRRGKAAFLTSLLITFFFFFARFAVAYFILLGLGLPTTPSSFVTIGPPIVQVVLVQTLLNFALYLSPTPGASGVAEAASTAMMRPWVTGPYELPYLVLWRVLALFLGMFVGGVYVFRYLGTDVLEARIKENEKAKAELHPHGGASSSAL
ncbi:MAG: flippase-like domain-containing protein [Byssovorax sp.]